ncbi:serine protease [Christiangramia crocea]|uniref:Serine protease n=1 Tax=Christiangramia crocea TaxID=2904124 RepID=A0A9X1UUV8_9FLAO|nr:serine protease [Gramella crocea]MCG9970526.1 serine protease [Gramella crocea]
MRKFRLILAIVIGLTGCKEKPPSKKEAWMDQPASEWPHFSLTNEISFADTTYTNLANSFLVNTGKDTLGVSCKHIFMVFQDQLGLQNIDLGSGFNYWKLYPKNYKEEFIYIKSLINSDSKEEIGDFNTLKVRDWLIFEIDEQNSKLYPLKIRYTPIRKNEIVYSVGWGMKQEDNSYPGLQKFKSIDNLGDYYYAANYKSDVLPYGRSGSPVIDENGYLVGIISGAEGNLTVIGSVQYLKKLFDQYKVRYTEPGR